MEQRGRGSSGGGGRRDAGRGRPGKPGGERHGAGAPKREPRPEEAPTDRGGFGPFLGDSRPGTRRRREAEAEGSPRRSGDDVRREAKKAVARGARPVLRLVKGRAVKGTEAKGQDKAAPAARRRRPAKAIKIELGRASPGREAPGPRVEERLYTAARAFDRGYERDAARILTPLRDAHPEVAEIRELLGLSLYRLGRWLAARKELEAYSALTGSAEQHPVIMDCARALGRHSIVARYWEELRSASPSSEAMTEGRIVAAGALADRGRIPEAIKLLEHGPVSPKRVAPQHLRLWYALADLHERSGDLPGARALFRKVSANDPGFVDVAQRLAGLS